MKDEKKEKRPFVFYDDYGNVIFNYPKIIKTAIFCGIVLVLLIVGRPFKIVGATERGIRYLFGAPDSVTLEPGINFHVPFVGKIKTWSISPNKLAINIPISDAGAISKDNQIIGVRVVVYWNYDESRIYDIAIGYSEKAIENLVASEVNSSTKTVIGSYTIFDLADNQSTIGDRVAQSISSKLASRPIRISQVNISNFEWSKDFDAQINATMKTAQQVKEAEQRANIAEQESKREIIESQARALANIAAAEGRLKTAELEAKAVEAKAEGDKNAKIAEGEGIQRYNQMVAQNLSVEIRLRELEIELEKAKRWDGRQVPTYVPLSPNGGIVTLPPAREFY